MSHELRHQLDNDEENEYLPEQEGSRLSDDAPNDRSDTLELRLRIVDRLLSTAPMLAPSAEFAERVIKAIRERRDVINWNASTGLALGLMSIVIISLSLTVIGLLAIASLILNWTQVYQSLVIAGGEGSSVLATLLNDLQATVADSPFLLSLSFLSIPLSLIWVWVMRKLSPSRRVQ